MTNHDKQHLKNLTQYEQQVAALMEQTQRLIANTVWALVSDSDRSTGEPFLWDNHQMAKMRMEQMVSQLNDNIQQTIENGINLEWQLSNTKNDEVVTTALGDYLASMPEERRSKYLNNHDEARKAFLARKVNGMSLSERVWDLSAGYKEELEMGISVALQEGTSAATLSKKLCQYLKNPEALYRRVRNQYGELELSKHARAYHPGQGVYRSAYKNAMRLAGTEINIAYRTSDYDRWQDMDFVVGVEIEPSNTNHKDYDICNTLAGKYPKEFKFTGWHPNCRCHATPILKTPKEMERDRERIMRGEEPLKESGNTVAGVPEQYERWVKENQKRIEARRTLPDYLRDNGSRKEGQYAIRKSLVEERPAFAITSLDIWKEYEETNTNELKEAQDALQKKLQEVKTLPYGERQTKLETMRYHSYSNDEAVNSIARRVVENEVREAYRDEILERLMGERADFARFTSKSKEYAERLESFNKAVADGNRDKMILQGKDIERRYDEYAYKEKPKKVTLPSLSDSDISEAFKRRESLSSEEKDAYFRDYTQKVWAGLTYDERKIITKYTTMYGYVNNPLRGVPLKAGEDSTERFHDMPVLTRVLSKFTMPRTTVVRRDLDDYFDTGLGKNISQLGVGDIITDKGFLSTTVKKTSVIANTNVHFVICVPEGAQGLYLEPFSRFTDSGCYSFTDTLWNGTTKETLGNELEWLGQRGTKMEVIKRRGSFVYLKIIGQLE